MSLLRGGTGAALMDIMRTPTITISAFPAYWEQSKPAQTWMKMISSGSSENCRIVTTRVNWTDFWTLPEVWQL
jgi:hypothetical protein